MMLQADSWFRERMAEFGGEIRFDELLSKHTYYRIGGPARWVLIPASVDDLAWIAEGMRAEACPWVVLGLGSNILASDEGFAGAVIKTSRLGPQLMEELPLGEDGILRTGAGVAVSSLLRRASSAGWGGLEFLTGIPGSVGGAVRMNAGTHLGESSGALAAVEAFDLLEPTLGVRRYEGEALKFSYRTNHFLPPSAVVTAAEWRFRREEPEAVRARIAETLARRKVTQPIDYPSCGSVFKNPGAGAVADEGLRAAWQVLDRLGLRGKRLGDAQFSEKHPNFIINLGAAKAADVRALIEEAKTRALAELGVRLEEEVRFVGRFTDS